MLHRWLSQKKLRCRKFLFEGLGFPITLGPVFCCFMLNLKTCFSVQATRLKTVFYNGLILLVKCHTPRMYRRLRFLKPQGSRNHSRGAPSQQQTATAAEAVITRAHWPWTVWGEPWCSAWSAWLVWLRPSWSGRGVSALGCPVVRGPSGPEGPLWCFLLPGAPDAKDEWSHLMTRWATYRTQTAESGNSHVCTLVIFEGLTVQVKFRSKEINSYLFAFVAKGLFLSVKGSEPFCPRCAKENTVWSQSAAGVWESQLKRNQDRLKEFWCLDVSWLFLALVLDGCFNTGEQGPRVWLRRIWNCILLTGLPHFWFMYKQHTQDSKASSTWRSFLFLVWCQN